MKFFVPGTADEQQALEAWDKHRQECEVTHNRILSDSKIFKILYGGESQTAMATAQVGQVSWVARELVLAIFGPNDPNNPQGLFIVATASKTLTVDPALVVSIEAFEE